MTCGAYTERYTGKGKDRVKHAGACPYERGHDGDHIPPSMVTVDWVPVPKAEMTRAKELVALINAPDDQVPPLEGAQALGELSTLIIGWPDAAT